MFDICSAAPMKGLGGRIRTLNQEGKNIVHLHPKYNVFFSLDCLGSYFLIYTVVRMEQLGCVSNIVTLLQPDDRPHKLTRTDL